MSASRWMSRAHAESNVSREGGALREQSSLATRTMDTEVDVPNPALILIPGMYAEVDLTLQRASTRCRFP